MSNVVLIGFPASGKTTVGAFFAALMGRSFADSDKIVEQRLGEDIGRIFTLYGEKIFREAEKAVCMELARRDDCVISLGGGAIFDDGTLAAFRKNSVMVLLDTPFEVCFSRLEGEPTRPLCTGKTREELAALFESRKPFYCAAADVTVRPSGDAENTAKEIISALRKIK